jgi:hypothetical protein
MARTNQREGGTARCFIAVATLACMLSPCSSMGAPCHGRSTGSTERWQAAPKSPKEIAGHRISKLFTFNPDDTPDKTSSSRRFLSVQDILQDDSGLIRVCTSFDFLVYDESTERWASFKSPTFERASTLATQMALDGSGRLWIPDRSKPVYFDGTWHMLQEPEVSSRFAGHFPVEERASSALRWLDSLHCLFSTRDGRVLFVRADEIGTFSGPSWRSLVAPTPEAEATYARLPRPQFKGKDVPSLNDHESESPTGVWPNDPDTKRLLSERPFSLLSEVYCGAQDKSGYIWLGADRAAIRLTPAGRGWQIHPLPKGLVNAAGVYEGRDRTLWFFDSYGDLASYDQHTEAWVVYNLIDQFPDWELDPRHHPSEAIRDLFLSQMPRDKWPEPPPNRPLRVHAMYEDREGQIMLGTSSGLVIFNRGQNSWHIFTKSDDGLPGDQVNCIFEDRSGQIWLGANAGIVVLARNP